MDVRVGFKLDHIGPQMGQIWDFLRSVLKSPRFVPFGANLIHFEGNPDTHEAEERWTAAMAVASVALVSSSSSLMEHLLDVSFEKQNIH